MVLPSQPEIGRTIPLATRYAVSVQVVSSLLTDMVPAMCGSATLTMVVSRISMKATSVTTSAITHGLTAGFQFASSAACWVPLTSGRRSLQVDGRIDGQAERQGQPG